jgi:hypothetical protein
MSTSRRRARGTRIGGTRRDTPQVLRKIAEINLGAIDSDEDDNSQAVEQFASQPSTSITTRPQLLAKQAKVSKFTVKKSTDNIQLILEQMKTINLRMMAIEEKIDKLHHLINIMYKPTRCVPISGRKSEIFTVTNW